MLAKQKEEGIKRYYTRTESFLEPGRSSTSTYLYIPLYSKRFKLFIIFQNKCSIVGLCLTKSRVISSIILGETLLSFKQFTSTSSIFVKAFIFFLIISLSKILTFFSKSSQFIFRQLNQMYFFQLTKQLIFTKLILLINPQLSFYKNVLNQIQNGVRFNFQSFVQLTLIQCLLKIMYILRRILFIVSLTKIDFIKNQLNQ
ncbi:transmembrane protein, putative (macronuclear) [Tetrahymena thermophila SB210]|uniref:Transmembrane protein, putative n=1 Tax=Tetrahymena thermophila (strain SB210) TaxID=312017 RepID=W7XI12_TETTS|nr:transmembrane protein, putative [Tetrahymena thermophila SB210]EWS72884.1 transmembrane protein, putative [Tetrahymena thermophila SB210]|eukprot:XP_012654581.1 transmembrane protein, putative [Tetrahymena thermophila SB210]